MKVVKTFPIKEDLLNMVQAYYEDYRAKQDLITMLFELHKFDEDATILTSVPFLHYEKQFREAKIAYDTVMEEIKNTMIPDEYKTEKYQFEINFNERVVDIKER